MAKGKDRPMNAKIFDALVLAKISCISVNEELKKINGEKNK